VGLGRFELPSIAPEATSLDQASRKPLFVPFVLGLINIKVAFAVGFCGLYLWLFAQPITKLVQSPNTKNCCPQFLLDVVVNGEEFLLQQIIKTD
jgi:hypothetical protein